MAVPLRQNLRIGTYLLKHRIKRTKYYPFIVEIEPLFACNLACPGCGKIQYPTEILRKRLSVEDVLTAVKESGTPLNRTWRLAGSSSNPADSKTRGGEL